MDVDGIPRVQSERAALHIIWKHLWLELSVRMVVVGKTVKIATCVKG